MDDTDLDLSFAIDAETVSLSTIGEYQVLNLEGAVVIVGDASYRVVPVGEKSDLSEDVRELGVDEIRAALDELADNDDFQSIVDNCPTNTPLVYDDIDYLTRHLPTNSLQKCQELSESTPFEKELRKVKEKAPCFSAGMNPITGTQTTNFIMIDSIS